MTTFHPRRDDHGQPVEIRNPDSPSALDAWHDPAAIAVAVPDCTFPPVIGNIAITPWNDAPRTRGDWEALVRQVRFKEPPMPSAYGKEPAAGAVVVEPDSRTWVVAPTNGYGGYLRTFPKGRLNGMSPHATAIKEVFEESGLHIELTGYLCDAMRSVTLARYYLARRIGGTPAAMGWESQAVLLVPPSELLKVLQHPNDKPVLAALQAQREKGA